MILETLKSEASHLSTGTLPEVQNWLLCQ